MVVCHRANVSRTVTDLRSRLTKIFTICLIGGGLPAIGFADTASVDIDAVKSQSEAIIRSRMVDPSSTQLAWPFRFTNAKLNGFFAPSTYGYWTCGAYNSRNRMGGYVGENWFLVISDGQRVTSLDLGPGGVNVRCQNAVASGLLTESRDTAKDEGPGYGFDLADVPDGLYIREVNAGSVAEAAGFKAGMVIEAINSIPLKGMDFSTRIAVLRAAQGEVSMVIIGKGPIRVTRPQRLNPQPEPSNKDVDSYRRDFGASFIVNVNPPKGEKKTNPPTPYGLMIVNLEKGGDLDRFGLKNLDVIVSLDGKAVRLESRLRQVYDDLESGKEVEFQILRRLKPMTLTAKIP